MSCAEDIGKYILIPEINFRYLEKCSIHPTNFFAPSLTYMSYTTVDNSQLLRVRSLAIPFPKSKVVLGTENVLIKAVFKSK